MATALTLTDGLIQQTEGFALKSDVSSELKNYLPLTGGNLSGSLALPEGDEITVGGNSLATETLLGSYSQVIAPDSGTLSPSQYNSYIQIFGPITLMEGGLVGEGSTITLKNDSDGPVVIRVTSTDFIFSPNNGAYISTTSVTLQPGDTIMLVSRGSGEWDVAGGTWLIRNLVRPYYAPAIVQYTVSTLPTSASLGTIAQVTDAVNPAWHQPFTGGGSTLCNALFNGTSWVAT